MPGKSCPPETIAEAIALRVAGYSVASIADRLSISVRTLQRLFARHSTKKGAVQRELLDAARANLLQVVTSDERIKELAASAIHDDLAHITMLRTKMGEALEHMHATSLAEAALLMRAAAAYSTALKNSSDTIRHALRPERAIDREAMTELPELTVREMTANEVLQVQQARSSHSDDEPPPSGGA